MSQAKSHLVGDVMSSWNSFRHTGPIRVRRAAGARVWDEAGQERIDWIMGWGSLILGHTPSFAGEAVAAALNLGFGCQYETEDNHRLANAVFEAFPSADCLRLANSGTEATLHAIRISRAVTGRRKILKFEGHFHGLNDYLLFGVDGSVRMGAEYESGLIEPVEGSRGLPVSDLMELVIVVPFNNIAAVEEAFRLHGNDIAAVILEPISLNTGCVFPNQGFLQFLRNVCDRQGSLLIFDEILTGFRVGPGGAQGMYGVAPDLTCLGKGLGCGFPVAAVCGRRDHMESLSPIGTVEMAGTNTGRRLAVIGTLAAIDAMRAQRAWEVLQRLNDRFVAGAREVFARASVPCVIQGAGGRIGVHIGLEEAPTSFRDITNKWNRAFHVECYMKATEKYGFYGFLLPLGPCPEPVTLSAAHTDADIDETLNRLEALLRETPYVQ